MADRPVIGVIGAGFTGSLTAFHLLSHGPAGAQIYLIEKTAGFGRGLAFGAHNASHFLNVRASNMSAFPDEPDHLVRWLARRPEHGSAGADAFITRGVYGDYLNGLLRAVLAGADAAERLVLVPDQATAIGFDSGGAILTLAMGRTIRLDAVVLAIGNLPPLSPSGLGLERLSRALYAPDPWADEALRGIAPEAEVLVLGTGLTMIDIVLDLAARGHSGPITALSRRGLAPNRHAPVGPVIPPDRGLFGRSLSAWVADRRARSNEVGWRAAVDELRPITQALWRAAGPAERRRFLRHLRPWWDVARHRMSPQVADKIDALRADGRLRLRAGRLIETEVHAGDGEDAGVRVRWRARGEDVVRTCDVARIINCTGAGADLSRTNDPLLRSLIDQGEIRADPLGLGLEIDYACQVLDAAGRASRPLYAAGPITQGYSWEVVAVPDIRNQVADLAAILTARLEGAEPARASVSS
jgi:uncharacterized NAD(P)/FAD-binding protein YdhS